MKIQFQKTAGNVLFATLFTTGIICLYMGSYLTLVRSENQTTKRSQTWNMAIPVAEAGIEEALAQIHSTFPNVKETTGWTSMNGGNYIVKTNLLNPDEYYIVGIFPPNSANGTTTPVIVSEGFVRLPARTNFVSRTVRVNTAVDGSVVGMVVVTSADMSGTKIVVDSFNSTNSAFSTNGKYDVTKRGDKVILATLSNVKGSLDLGNADVWGKVASGYNGTPPKMGPNSIVGSTKWHKDGNKGLEDGAYMDNINMTVEAPTAPYTSAIEPPKDANGVITLGTGDYAVENLTGRVIVTGKARLLVTKTFSKVSSLIISNLTGTASLELYAAAPDVDISGGILNVQGRASNFKYYGLSANPALNWPGNKTLKAGGNGQFTAMVNAPETALELAGGGRAAEDFSGACLVNTVVMKGHYSFHFDEACAGEMPKGFVTASWDEIDTDWETILAKNYTVKDLY